MIHRIHCLNFDMSRQNLQQQQEHSLFYPRMYKTYLMLHVAVIPECQKRLPAKNSRHQHSQRSHSACLMVEKYKVIITQLPGGSPVNQKQYTFCVLCIVGISFGYNWPPQKSNTKKKCLRTSPQRVCILAVRPVCKRKQSPFVKIKKVTNQLQVPQSNNI